jgi:glycolate dehydrogenase FAD-binding subunit
LHKLLIGSLGTLAVITRLNFRTFPVPALRRGFLAAFESDQDAVGFRRKVLTSPLTPTVLEILSPEATRLLFGRDSPIASLLTGESSWHVCVGFEGTPEVCDRYARELQRLAQDSGAHDALLLRETQYAGLAERLREKMPLLSKSSAQAAVFRFSGLQGETTALLRALRSFAASTWIPSAQVVSGRSELYLALLPKDGEESVLKQVAYFWKSVESLLGKLDFHLSLLVCPSEWKKELGVWGTKSADLAMMQRVKTSFDPQGVFAPGRFVGGI